MKEITTGGNGKVLDPLIVRLVNQLFQFFWSLCRGFEKQYENPKRLEIEKSQWVQAFMDEGISTKEQLDWGIRRTRKETPYYVPRLGEFLSWCNPSLESLGVPDTEAAYIEACKNSHPCAEEEWSHKVVKHACKLTGRFFLRTNARSVSFPVFARNYEITIREWRAGKEIEDITVNKALTKLSDPKVNKELNKKSIAECLRILKGDKS